MKNKKHIILLVVLMIILSLISIFYIIINGRTYTFILDSDNKSIEDINISFEKGNIVEIADKKIMNNKLKIIMRSLNEGKDCIQIDFDKDTSHIENIYVHKSGIITINTFLGDCTGNKIIPISISIWLAVFLYCLVKQYRNSIKKSLYQYKNISYMGLIIFFSIVLINQVVSIKNYNGLNQTVSDIIGMTTLFSMILLPISFFVSIGVTISNIILLIKEDRNWRNLLGFMLGLFLCITAIIPELLSNTLQSATWIDVHNSSGFLRYLETFIETVIYIIVAYLESILLGTIILSKKAAKRIPEFNKDFIIILGCKIENDGTLTNLLKGRVDRAIEFSKLQKEKTGKDIIFVTSGGKGKDEIISESIAMKNYLIENGISENQIVLEDKSKSTFENIKYSNDLIKKRINDAKIVISTTNYHVFRAGVIASQQNINVEGIGSKTKAYFWINAFIREFIAALYSEKKKHFFIVLTLIFISIFVIWLSWFSENL